MMSSRIDFIEELEGLEVAALDGRWLQMQAAMSAEAGWTQCEEAKARYDLLTNRMNAMRDLQSEPPESQAAAAKTINLSKTLYEANKSAFLDTPDL